MQCPWSKYACFLFGISLTSGMGRLNDGSSNKYISQDENGILIKESNLFIDGNEVIVNEETLLANNLVPTEIEYTEEQKQAIAAGIIAGLYQPEERPQRWAYLTFMVDEETYVELPEDTEVYERNPNSDDNSNEPMPDDDTNWPPPPPDDDEEICPVCGKPLSECTCDDEEICPVCGLPLSECTCDDEPKYDYIVDGEYVVPDSNGGVTLLPGVEYVIIGGSGGVVLPVIDGYPVEIENTVISANLSHTIEDYVDDDGNEMTKIVIPIGHNKIVIYFLASDKSADGSWYRVGANITIEAVATSGWEFVQWTIDESLIVTDVEYSFTVNYDSTFRAKFRQKGKSAMDGFEVVTSSDPANPDYVVSGYTITVVVDPEYPNGTVSGGGSYESGATISLIALPEAGYGARWYLGDTLVSTENTLTIIVDSDKAYTVRFKQLVVNPYGDGLSDCFDALLNKSTEYSSSIKHWENLMYPQPTFSKNNKGYISDKLIITFDGIDNKLNESHNSTTKIWYDLFGSEYVFSKNNKGYISDKLTDSFDAIDRGESDTDWVSNLD